MKPIFINIPKENKVMNYLVEQKNPDGTVLFFTKIKPTKSNTVYVFSDNNNLLSSFISHTKERPGALTPTNRTFANNLSLLLTKFPRNEESWLLEYLKYIMPVEKDISTNLIENWKSGLSLYNSSQINRNLKVDEEIGYLNALSEHGQSVFMEKLNSKNERVLKEEIASIDEIKSGSGVVITTSIEMDPSLRANVSEIIGKQYDAHLMVSSEANENKLKNFFIHEGIFNWLKKISANSVGSPELAASLTIGSITIILGGDNTSKGQNKKDFYPSLKEAIEAIATRCNYRLEITSIPTMTRNSSNNEKKKSSPTPVKVNSWQEKLNELASMVDSQLVKTNANTVKNIVNSIKKCFISKSDYESSKGIEDLNTKNKEKTVFRLDNWQTSLVESILAGESVIAIGPTSGGKTLTSMVALDQLFRRGGDNTLMYVAPNFYQAFQAYCNMVKTFPRQTFGLITGIINSNPKGCKYWVGTPEHLWTFAIASNMKFNIGIIDEIHTISSPETISFENKRKANCLVKLISLIKNQFVGLSATIHPDDEAKLASFVQNILSENGIKISIEYGLGGNKIERFIPLVNKVFTGSEILDVSEAKTDRTIRVTPENTFKLMKMLNDKKMTPSLIFDMEEKASYTLFSSLIKYMNDKYQEEYVTWRNINNNFSAEIANLNREIANEIANMEEERYARLKSKKDGLIQKIISHISSKIRSALAIKEIVTQTIPAEDEEVVPVKIWPGSTRPRRPRVIIPEDEIEKITEEKGETENSLKNLNMIEVSSSLRNMAPNLTSGQEFTLPNMISQEIADLYDELRNLKLELGKQDLREMFEVCSGIGSYYRFGPAKKSNVFRQLYSMDKSHITKEDETAYNIIASLSDAEGVKFDDVKQIFKLMDIALSFGIGILIPTMPFCVQFQIMKMLKEGDITIVFASESLSMGVNFPAKSCVIRTLQNGSSDITKVLQMGGRAGRRGAISDLEAYSITWNISNVVQIDEAQKNANNMPHLVLDLESIKDKKPEVMVNSHKGIAIELNKIMSTAASIEALKQTTAMLEKTTTRLTRGKKITSVEDENRTMAREAIGKKSKIEEDYGEEEEKERNPKTQNKESFSRDTSAVSAITRTVNVLAPDLNFSNDIVEKLNKRIEYITNEVVRAEMLDNPYEWAERINLVKQALQEVHTGLYKRKCVALLDYISTLYILVHRISMRYIGLVYQKDSSRTTKE